MEDLKAILKQNGIQVTQQRLDVLRVLKELNTHVTVDDVLAALKERHINLTVATAYNILNTFEKKNVIMKINTAGEPVIYDVNTYDHIHVCDCDTREVQDYDGKELLEIINRYFQKHPIEGVDLKRVDVNIIGSIKH